MEKKDLKKISDYIWEIPKSFRSDMRVPARVFASEKLVNDLFKDRSLEQLVNVATLPGIQKWALSMPDIHEGYGFCLSGDSKIMSPFGFYMCIKDFERSWKNYEVNVFNKKINKIESSGIKRFFKIKPHKKVLRVVTKSGKSIIATADHPFYASFGMKPAGLLKEQEQIAISGFDGVLYTKPLSKIVINKKDIKRTLLKLGIIKNGPRFKIILKKLSDRGLLSLTYDHPKLPYLIKIAAFIFGDGSMNFIGKRGDGIIHFSGQAEDLEEVKKDLEKLSYTSSKIHPRENRTKDGKITTNYSFYVNASSLVILLETLGIPRGRKVNQPYRIPKWIFELELWQKRLFLASLFGCELRMPHRRLNRRGNFNSPVFPMNKSEDLIDNGKQFLKGIANLLSEFEVEITSINQRRRHVAKDGIITYALELIISSTAENLINLWGKIGYEYNKKRSYLASAAVCYLRLKQELLQEKEEAIKIRIPELLERGLSYNRIAGQLSGNPLSARFIQDVCWKIKHGWKKIIPRVPPSFPGFLEYLERVTTELDKSGLVWEKIVKIEEIDFKDNVYDLTVDHQGHNFFANGFLVSNCIGGVAAFDAKNGIISPGGIGYDINCGVRLIKSPHTYQEIQDRIPDFATYLYHEVPSGVGRSGRLKLVNKELDEVLLGGVDKMIESGYATDDDKKHCESLGRLEDADPSLVSKTAKDRGRDQLGTIGSGNHFVEVQRVEKIFDGEAAKALGLFEDQVTIMVHCGSRGLGHQNATDYIKIMMNAMPKYGITLPDPELACAPFSSPEGQKYWKSMAAAANFAWANRQFITWEIRRAWQKVFGGQESGVNSQLSLIYDVAHNLAKREIYNGKELVVHRKGATRSFPSNHPETPDLYKDVGQPVLIPGSMGTASYVLVGQPGAMELSFGSSCHGAGRVMSRTKAKRQVRGSTLKEELEKRGIAVRSGSMSGLAEEAPVAYKDVEEVVDVVHNVGLAKKVARLKPVAVIKG